MAKVKKARTRAKTARGRRTKPARARTSAVESAVAALAHEIRTPLTGILALSELLATADLPERERGWAEAAKSAAEHLANLTTLIVDSARSQARGLTLRAEPFRLRAFIEAIGATLRARAEAAGLDADVSLADDLPETAIGDAVRLRAMLENLIDNAVKFTERGRVVLSVEKAKAARGRYRVIFLVTDSGVGLTREEIKRLFRPFAQANVGVAQRYGGSGLGLAFVARVAKAMGGGIAVASSAGRGSKFRLTVTLKESASGLSGAGTMSSSKFGRALRVLCVEDNPYARVVLNTVLREFGHKADFVGTGEAAVAAISKGYDLILMDMTLPDLDGIAAVRAIRALPEGNVPIIGISGRTELAQVEAALAAGMNAFLGKPVSPAALAKVIGEIVREVSFRDAPKARDRNP